MMLDSYIGYLDDPDFNFYGDSTIGNIPKRQSPSLQNAHKVFSVLCDLPRAAKEEYEVKQLDWGAIGAKMTKQQLSDFLKANDILNSDYHAKEIEQFIQGLADDRACVLVAYETGEEYGDD